MRETVTGDERDEHGRMTATKQRRTRQLLGVDEIWGSSIEVLLGLCDADKMKAVEDESGAIAGWVTFLGAHLAECQCSVGFECFCYSSTRQQRTQKMFPPRQLENMVCT